MAPDPRTAVVVITRDRAEELLRTVGRLRELPEAPRVVVVDNGSTDGTAAAVSARHPDVEVIALRRNLGAAARNVGVLRVTTPYVAFSDDDSWWAPGALRRAADRFDAHRRLAVVTGRILVGPEEREDPISDEMARSPLHADQSVPGPPLLSFLAGASVLRRRAFLAVGGFDPRFEIGGEEELLGADLAAAGWALRYASDVIVHHHPSGRRDPHHRRRQGIRNTLWFTWLRRPAGSAARRSAALARQVPKDRVSAAAVTDAARGLPWLLRGRRVVPPAVERGLRTLEAQQATSEARRYVS